MATDEFKEVIDRSFAKVLVQKAVDIACPLLQEIVNHASHAFRRCQLEASNEENVDLAAFSLYRQIIEQVDGIEVLLREGCSGAAVAPLRVAFEASLGLQYILQDRAQYRNRGLSWFYCYARNRLTRSQRLDPGTGEGKRFKNDWEKALGSYEPPQEMFQKQREGLDEFLARPQFSEIKEAYEGVKERRNRRPAWHALFDGPASIEDLADHLDEKVSYEALYRYWSAIVHASEASTQFTALEGHEGGGFRMIRDPQDFMQVANSACTLLLKATHTTVAFFRPGENLRVWYEEDVQEKYRKLWKSKIDLQYGVDPRAGAYRSSD